MTTTTTDLSIPRTLALGLVAGAMAGLFGVGGGIVLVPGLVLILRLAQHQAHATSLAAIIVTAPAALLPFVAEGSISWPAAAALLAGSLAGALGGADAMKRIPAARLRVAFGAFMIVIAIRLILPGGAAGETAVSLSTLTLLALAGVGLATGILSGVMGVGGGVVLVPVMVVGFGFSQLVAQGTSLAVIIPTALVGTWRHSRNGFTLWRTGLLVGAGGVVGGFAGGTIAQSLPEDGLQTGFAILLVVSGIRLMRKGRPASPADRGVTDAG